MGYGRIQTVSHSLRPEVKARQCSKLYQNNSKIVIIRLGTKIHGQTSDGQIDLDRFG